jgi:hypothetical protein
MQFEFGSPARVNARRLCHGLHASEYARKQQLGAHQAGAFGNGRLRYNRWRHTRGFLDLAQDVRSQVAAGNDRQHTMSTPRAHFVQDSNSRRMT